MKRRQGIRACLLVLGVICLGMEPLMFVNHGRIYETTWGIRDLKATALTPRSSSQMALWVQLEEGPRAIQIGISEEDNVDSLLKKFKAEVAPALDKVPVFQLQLYLTKTANEALEPDQLVRDLWEGGTSAKTALYVRVQAVQEKDTFDLIHDAGQKRFLEALRQKFPCPEERFLIPRPLCGGFFFGKVVQRRQAFNNLLTLWNVNFNYVGDRGRAPIIALPAAPGTGKTLFAHVVARRGRRSNSDDLEAEWAEAFDELPDGNFKESIARAVAVTVTFNYNSDLTDVERLENRHAYMIGVRMLYSHFCRSASFEEFHSWLRACQCDMVVPCRALDLIRLDMRQSGRNEDDIILVVDEPLRTIEHCRQRERKGALGTLCSSIGDIITSCSNVHILMTSLSGPELEEAVTPLSRRPMKFVSDFSLLSSPSIKSLISAETGPVRERLRYPAVAAVLRQCLGLPRLLECTFKVARSGQVWHGRSTETIRALTQCHYDADKKYRNAILRRNALFAAFSSYRRHTKQRIIKTNIAEREGYLVQGLDSRSLQIPPIVLCWWAELFTNERELLDKDAEALLRAANCFVSLSDVRQPRDHGTNWEKQMFHLWRILVITDKMWSADRPKTLPRTILRQLGLNSLLHEKVVASICPRARLDAGAVFNIPLAEPPLDRLMSDCVHLARPADIPAKVTAGEIYFPADPDSPGYDFIIVDEVEKSSRRGAAVKVILVVVEAKFSAMSSSTKLTQADVVNKFYLMLKDRPNLRKAFVNHQLCYVIGGLRKRDVEMNITQVVGEIAKGVAPFPGWPSAVRKREELVRRSLVILDRDHVEGLLTPSLSSLPPFTAVDTDI